MRALRWHGARDLRLEQVPIPVAVAPDDVVIRPILVGLCGTDIHEYGHGPVMIRPDAHPLTGARPPVTLGHEFMGVVTQVGAGVADLALGQRVTVDPCIRCGECRWCQGGDYHICAKGGSVGLACDGALADRVVVKRYNTIAVPDTVSNRNAALAEPMAVALHAVRRSGIRAGSAVLVLGAGPIGLSAVMCASLAGAAFIAVSEPSEARRALAVEVGATMVLDPTETDVRREVFLATGRMGPDAVIEATGRPEQAALAVNSVMRGGAVVLVGVNDVQLDISLRSVVLSERRIYGSLGYNFDVARVVSLMSSGRLDATSLVSRVVRLEETEGALQDLGSGRSEHLKVLVSIDREYDGL